MKAGPLGFAPRWREELVVTGPLGTLVFEFTMGSKHVYFPDEARWCASVPTWAREHWQEYLAACRAWCERERVPLSVVGDAHVSEERG
jgi:hypothetical protein